VGSLYWLYTVQLSCQKPQSAAVTCVRVKQDAVLHGNIYNFGMVMFNIVAYL
jgi:hypothetical protein